jgi:magnesium chelatase family protein
VLFLDELPEFSRRALEVLRQPLEEGSVSIARAARSVRFPARFALVAAMNPCPCGFHGDGTGRCRCTPQMQAQYSSRLSGPLRDRIDLIVDVPAVPAAVVADDTPGEPSAAVRARVAAARDRQRPRLGDGGAPTNAELTRRGVARWCRPDDRGRALLSRAAEKFGLTARACDRVLKVSRTLADLAGSSSVLSEHVAEALQYRLVE